MAAAGAVSTAVDAAPAAGAVAESAGAGVTKSGAKSPAKSGGKSVKSAARNTVSKARRAGGEALAGGARGTGTAARNVVRGQRTSPATAKKVVLFAVVVSGGVVVLYDLKNGKLPNVRLGVGVMFAGVMLSALADVIPEIAAPLALLMVLGVLLVPQSGGTSPGQELLKSIRAIVPAGGVRGA